MYFNIGTPVCVTTCDNKQFIGEITHIVIQKSESEIESLLFLREFPSQRGTYGNACILVNQIRNIVQYPIRDNR